MSSSQTKQKKDKLQRKGEDLTITADKKEKAYRKKHPITDLYSEHHLDCTKCGKSLERLIKRGYPLKLHPILQVLLCPRCEEYYGDGDFSMDEDGDDKYCRWCGEGGVIFVCSSCTFGFCPKCIRRHFGRNAVEKIKLDESWQCYGCKPQSLWKMRSVAEVAAEVAGRNNVEYEKKQKDFVPRDTLESITNDPEGSEAAKYDEEGDEKVKLAEAREFLKLCRYLKSTANLCIKELNTLQLCAKRVSKSDQLKLLCENLARVEGALTRVNAESRAKRLQIKALPDDPQKPLALKKKKEKSPKKIKEKKARTSRGGNQSQYDADGDDDDDDDYADATNGDINTEPEGKQDVSDRFDVKTPKKRKLAYGKN